MGVAAAPLFSIGSISLLLFYSQQCRRRFRKSQARPATAPILHVWSSLVVNGLAVLRDGRRGRAVALRRMRRTRWRETNPFAAIKNVYQAPIRSIMLTSATLRPAMHECRRARAPR
jgi:hypothetical protein